MQDGSFFAVGGGLLVANLTHDFTDGLLNIVDPPPYVDEVSPTHLVDPADDVGAHRLEPILHLLEKVLDEVVQLLGGRILRLPPCFGHATMKIIFL